MHPDDCVHLAVTGMLDRQPDMVISGTMPVPIWAMTPFIRALWRQLTEGFLLGIPSIAVSLAGEGIVSLRNGGTGCRSVGTAFCQTSP